MNISLILWCLLLISGVLITIGSGYLGFRVTGLIVRRQRYNRNNAIDLLLSDRPEDWNALREADSSWTPDLRKVALRNLNLNGANLRRATLDEADLSYSNLENADLSEASLTYAKLFRASLRSALFDNANLSNADLKEADITNASFDGAILSGAGFNKEAVTPHRISRPSLSDVSFLKEIKRNPDILNDLKPIEFEKLIADIFHAQGFEVELTARTGDGGKDIIAVQDSPLGKNVMFVEAKRYAKNRPVNVAVVRSLLGVTEMEGATKGILVTSSYFTKDAQQLADKHRHRLQLADREQLLKWIDNIEIHSKSINKQEFLSQKINLDTLTAYAEWKYPNFTFDRQDYISSLINDLKRNEYLKLNDIDNIVNNTEKVRKTVSTIKKLVQKDDAISQIRLALVLGDENYVWNCSAKPISIREIDKYALYKDEESFNQRKRPYMT
jgi:hypothetical protein